MHTQLRVLFHSGCYCHYITQLIICTEHVRLLHAGPTLLSCSLSCRFHMIGGHQAVLSVTCACITCTWNSVKPRKQITRQLPLERISADYIFCRVGGDFTGPFTLS